MVSAAAMLIQCAASARCRQIRHVSQNRPGVRAISRCNKWLQSLRGLNYNFRTPHTAWKVIMPVRVEGFPFYRIHPRLCTPGAPLIQTREAADFRKLQAYLFQ